MRLCKNSAIKLPKWNTFSFPEISIISGDFSIYHQLWLSSFPGEPGEQVLNSAILSDICGAAVQLSGTYIPDWFVDSPPFKTYS